MKVSVTKNEVKITELSQVNQGDYKVNFCTFVLPECFSGLSVTAVFNGIPVPVVENRCYIPSLESGNCILGVYAYKEENGETKLMYSPKPTVFYVDKGSFTTDVNTEALPKVFDYETYCNMLKDFWEQIVKENTPSSYNEKTNIYFNKFPFEVIDLLSTTESNYAYIIENGKCRPKDKSEKGFSPITKCPKYLGFRIEDDETRVYLYIGDKVNGKFELDEDYIIDTTDSGAVNHLRQSHNRFIETDGEKYFYYKVNEGSKDKVTLIGCDEFPEGESDIIATVPNYIKGGKKVGEDNYLPPETKLAGEKYYSVVLPSGCFYAVLNKRGMPTFLKDDDEDEETTTKPIFNVSYQTDVTVVDGKEVPIIEVNRGASFGVIPENVGAALLRLPYTYELSDLCIYTSTPVKSNAKSGKRRKAKEIGEKLIKDFYFKPRKEIFWNDSVRPMRVGRTFYGVPYSSRWVNSHYLGFEVSAETVLYALNDPYSVAYEGGFVSADFVTDEKTGKEVPVKKYRDATYSGYTEISGKEDEPEKDGGPGYGLVCSAFTNLICGNPYPQSNRGYTFDSNYVLEDTSDMNSGEILVNKGLSHCVFVDEIYDKGYSLYEAVDPCVAKTTHTCPADKTTYAASKVRTSTLDKYVYSVINKDISGYEKIESLLNFENIEIKSGKVRPWRGNKAVYGSWDITPKTNNRNFGGSGIGVTLHDDTTKFILKYPSYATKTIDKADPECYQYFQKNGKYADISAFVTENGTYELYTVDETTGEKNSETEYFRFYNHDTVQLTFDEEGKAVFKYSDGKNKGKVAEDVEYIYVNVKGYGGEFGKDTSLKQEESGAMVIAAGKCYPDLALDTSRILDVRAAIVSDPEGDYWGKYSCATSPDVVSEYKGGIESVDKEYVDEKHNQVQEQIDLLNQGGLNLKEDFLGEQVDEWLNEHPEATTTVQDGSLTPEKFNEDAKKWIRGGVLNVKDFGAKGDGVTDDTQAIKNAVDMLTDGDTLYFPSATYLVSFDMYADSINNSARKTIIHLYNKHNITIDFGNSTLILKAGGFNYAYMVEVSCCKNFTIKNGTLIGDKINHDYTVSSPNSAHEIGYGIYVNCKDEVNGDTSQELPCYGIIDNCDISQFIGDAVCTQNGTGTGKINIKNCYLHDCRRQGVSILSSDDIYIENTIIENIGIDEQAYSPKCGIDIEANSDTKTVNSVELQNVIIRKCGDSSLLKHNGTVLGNFIAKNCQFASIICDKGTTEEKMFNGDIYDSIIGLDRLSPDERRTLSVSGGNFNCHNCVILGVVGEIVECNKMYNCRVIGAEDYSPSIDSTKKSTLRKIWVKEAYNCHFERVMLREKKDTVNDIGYFENCTFNTVHFIQQSKFDDARRNFLKCVFKNIQLADDKTSCADLPQIFDMCIFDTKLKPKHILNNCIVLNETN